MPTESRGQPPADLRHLDSFYSVRPPARRREHHDETAGGGIDSRLHRRAFRVSALWPARYPGMCASNFAFDSASPSPTERLVAADEHDALDRSDAGPVVQQDKEIRRGPAGPVRSARSCARRGSSPRQFFAHRVRTIGAGQQRREPLADFVVRAFGAHRERVDAYRVLATPLLLVNLRQMVAGLGVLAEDPRRRRRAFPLDRGRPSAKYTHPRVSQ